MPDWTAPFHRPHLTTEEFEKQRDTYVAENGYTIRIPSLDDVIHTIKSVAGVYDAYRLLPGATKPVS